MSETASANSPATPSLPTVAKSPDSDVSPRTQTPSKPVDYFSADPNQSRPASKVSSQKLPTSPSSLGGSTTTTGSPSISTADGHARNDSRASSNNDTEYPATVSRKSSIASVSFRGPADPKLPRGQPRKTDAKRLRDASPKPQRFRRHVGFDNLHIGEATKDNTCAFILNVRHQGYHSKRRSRTFMAGVDEHDYSLDALNWLLRTVVDDGDEVVCVRVIEEPGRRSYQQDAKALLQKIQDHNENNRAISLVLEYSFGKLHATFQKLIQIYQPSMLIVGTKGRSMGGIQGLMSSRNSFSKYCLQYSPVPVVVVRPDAKRLKKREQRMNNNNRQTYAAMLSSNPGGCHETDMSLVRWYELEDGLSPDQEAHKVAAALGLPASFDPTIKPLKPKAAVTAKQEESSAAVHSPSTTKAPAAASTSTGRNASPPAQAPSDSGDEESAEEGGEEEEEYEIEVFNGQDTLLGEKLLNKEQKKRLHAMEVGEAAALRKPAGEEEEEEAESSEGSEEKTAKA